MQSESKITLINYTKDNVQEKQLQSVDEILKYNNNDSITWIRVEGVDNTDIIKQMGDLFDIHPLSLKNLQNPRLNSLFEEHNEYLYISLNTLVSQNGQTNVSSEKVSILLFDNLLITFKEKTNDLFQPIQKHIKENKADFRSLGTDYLAYNIINTIVDQYDILIAEVHREISSLEDDLLNSKPMEHTASYIQHLKKDIYTIEKNIVPIKELMSRLVECESELMLPKTNIYLQDITNRLTHTLETNKFYNDILSGLLDTHANIISFKMNAVMQMLTLYATIFIPLTFVAGVYGMNFEDMPELKSEWGYQVVWAIFILVPILMITFFKKKRWI